MDWTVIENIALMTGLIGGVGFVLAFLIAIPTSEGSRIADAIMVGAVGCLLGSLVLAGMLGLHAVWS